MKDSPKSKAGIRDIPVPEKANFLIDIIRNLNPNSDYVFVNGDGNLFTRSALTHKLKRICKKLDIVEKSTHKLRKTYITILFENGIPTTNIMALAGHAQFETTERHYIKNRSSVENLAEIIKNIPAPGMD